MNESSHLMRVPQRLPRITVTAALLTAAATGLATLVMGAMVPRQALAQGTPSLMEFRWDGTKDYRKLYFFMTDSIRRKRAEYYLILRPKDRKTAILKLTVAIPQHFDATINEDEVKLCVMSEGGMLKRTRCKETIPATVEVSPNGRAIDIYPDTPVSDKETIGVYMRLFNPDEAGMYQFNALAQAPGALPVSGYLGSWLIQIDPN